MLTSVHILLTYACPLKCNHCFVYAGPQASGKLTSPIVTRFLEQISLIKSIEWIIFDGGEPFLVFPILLTSVKRAKGLGFKVGIISNGYFGRSEEAAARYLKPLVAQRLDRIFISSDHFHYKNLENSPAEHVIRAAKKLGIPTTRIRVSEHNLPAQDPVLDDGHYRVENHPLMMVGRATENIQSTQPSNNWESCNICPFKQLEDPETIFIDPYGNVQICQGISLGNIWFTPLNELMVQQRISSHPIYGPLIRKGPKGLVEEYDLAPRTGYLDACHLCYTTRLKLADRFPEFLSPPQVYNLRI